MEKEEDMKFLHTMIRVKDLERSEKFYKEALLKKVIHFQKSLKLTTQLLRNWQKTTTLTTSI